MVISFTFNAFVAGSNASKVALLADDLFLLILPQKPKLNHSYSLFHMPTLMAMAMVIPKPMLSPMLNPIISMLNLSPRPSINLSQLKLVFRLGPTVLHPDYSIHRPLLWRRPKFRKSIPLPSRHCAIKIYLPRCLRHPAECPTFLFPLST